MTQTVYHDWPAIIDHATTLRHRIHQHPELAYEERDTAKLVRAELDRLGIAWEACAETGTLGRLAVNADGPHIALRADMDALPIHEATGLPYASCRDGHMHACGHDGHTASLLATAAWLAAHETALAGPVTLLFQPAEEQGSRGAKAMIDAGALDGIERIYGYHNWPSAPWGTVVCCDGPLLAANGAFTCVVQGRGGHASQPERCRDPIQIASQLINALHQLVSRRLAPLESGLLSVTSIHGGTSNNIIPDQVEIIGSIRGATSAIRDQLAEWAEVTIRGLEVMHEVTIEWHFDPGYPATVNHPAEAATVRRIAARTLGEGSDVESGHMVMASEDFSYYLEQIPGAFMLLGSGENEHTPGLHTAGFDYNDRLLPIITRIYSQLVGLDDPIA